MEIWPLHGFYSLTLFVAPIIPAWLFDRLLSERYYRVRGWESSGRVYERLGIRFFKRFVPNGDYINRIIRHSDKSYRVIRDAESTVRHGDMTRLAERCHLAALWLPVPCIVYALMLGWNKFALWLFLANVPIHVYPVLLQRYTRARIQKVLTRRKQMESR